MEQAVGKYADAIVKFLEWQNRITDPDNNKFEAGKVEIWQEVLNYKFDIDSRFELADLFRQDRAKFADDTNVIFSRLELRMQDLSTQFIESWLRQSREGDITKHLQTNVEFINDLIGQSFRSYHYQMLYRNLAFNHNEHIERFEQERDKIVTQMQGGGKPSPELKTAFNNVNNRLEFLYTLQTLVYLYHSKVSYVNLGPYIEKVKDSKEPDRYLIAIMIYVRLHEVQAYFETQVYSVEEETALLTNTALPIQQRIISHYSELTLKFRGNAIIGIRGYNGQREDKLFNDELVELYALPPGFNMAAFKRQVSEALEKENELFEFVRLWSEDYNLYMVGKLQLPASQFDEYFLQGLSKIYTKYLIAGRLKISNWREREGKKFDGSFIKLFIPVLAAKRNYLRKVLAQLEILYSSHIASIDVVNVEQPQPRKYTAREYALAYIFDLYSNGQQVPEKPSEGCHDAKEIKKEGRNRGFEKPDTFYRAVRDVLSYDLNKATDLNHISKDWYNAVKTLSQNWVQVLSYLKGKGLGGE